ncbi:hypothetical protein [Actinoplanes utahensis]|uniref:hypothetical protein n=1 Tax=Actinoplanes utahensis TaxID=1869 RepID=UPI00126A28C9|nr:hypothetical protein [Actinoplanes utahensis]
MNRSWVLSPLAGLAVLAGCSGGEQPRPMAVAPSASQPAAVAPVYTGIRGECPELSSPESVRYTGSQPPRSYPLPRLHDSRIWIHCGWLSPSSGKLRMEVRIQIFRDGFKPAFTGHGNAAASHRLMADMTASEVRGKPAGSLRVSTVTTAYGEALVRADGTHHTLTQTTLTGNAVLTVIVKEPEDSATDVATRTGKMLGNPAAAADAITAEVAKQLLRQR